MQVIPASSGRIDWSWDGEGTGSGFCTDFCYEDRAEYQFVPGDKTLVLTATPIWAGYMFAGWSGSCSGGGSCTLSFMTDGQVATATFVPFVVNYDVWIQKQGPGASSSWVGGSGFDCGSVCYQSLSQGTAVSLSYTLGSGVTFGGWSGPCGGTGTCSFSVNGNTTVYAQFNTGPPPPDYQIGGIGTMPSPVVEGQLVTFSALVRNAGGGAGSFSLTRLRLDGNIISPDQTTTALASGTSEIEQWPNAWIATSGTHTLEACADIGGVIAESNEANNCQQISFTTGFPTAPDYVVPASSLTTIPATPAAGELVSFRATVRNQGTQGGGVASFTHLRLDIGNNGTWDLALPDQTTSALAAGASEVETWANYWVAQAAGTSHKFEVCADVTNVINEQTAETNNCAQSIFTVGAAPPTLSVTLSPSASGPPPLPVNFSADVSGTATGTINYSFWWNCNSTSTSVSQTNSACGTLTTPSPGACVETVGIGYKCNSVLADPQAASHTYTTAGSYIAKVIVERGSASPAENRVSVTVSGAAPPPSAGPSTARFCIDTPGGASECMDVGTNKIGDFPVGTLASGTFAAVGPTTGWTATPGPHWVYLCADVGSVTAPGIPPFPYAVSETDETDNCASQLFTVIPLTYTLTVTGTGTGTGIVTSSPSGINCSYTSPGPQSGDCQETYLSGESIVLTPTPGAGNTFSGWSGDPDCADGVVTMNANKSCTANFTAPAPKPNLVVVSLAIPNGTPGAWVTATVQIQNTSSTTGTGIGFRVGINNGDGGFAGPMTCADDEFGVATSALGPLGVRTVSVPVQLPSAAGSYIGYAFVDSGDLGAACGVIDESEEADNAIQDFYGTCSTVCPTAGSRQCLAGTPAIDDYQVCADFDLTAGTTSGCSGTSTCLCWSEPQYCPQGKICRAVDGSCAALPEWREITPSALIDAVSRFLRRVIPTP